MKKIYILDTSALIYDPVCYKHLHNSKVIIPIAVLNELDNLKKQPNEVGKHARVCIKLLDELSKIGDISSGIELENEITISIDTNYYLNEDRYIGFGDPNYGDTQILICAYIHWLEFKDVVLVSNDINLRIKAKARGIGAQDHQTDKFSLNELYSGQSVVDDDILSEELIRNSKVETTKYVEELCINECISFENPETPVLARKISETEIKTIKKQYPWNLSPRNKEQIFAIDLIMDKEIDLVTLIGKAGSGKSLIVLASALELLFHKKAYDKLIIYRPIQSVGNDIGFLPGSLEEKMAPWFQAIMDNFEFLLGAKNKNWRKDFELWQQKGLIELGAITYIRGRSIPNSIMIIDEAQNLSKEEIKTILTRAGESTKIIMNGDIEQIDNSMLDATNNGLTYAIEKFKNSPIAGHITFTKGERSRLASVASEIL